MNLQANDSVAALAIITYADLIRGVDGGTQDEVLASIVTTSDSSGGSSLAIDGQAVSDEVVRDEEAPEEEPVDDNDDLGEEEAATEAV